MDTATEPAGPRSLPAYLARSDTELMSFVAAGDPEAFAALHNRYAAAALRRARRLLGHSSAAEEVVQDAFLALWRSQYQPGRGSVRGLLLSIVQNRAIDAARRQHRRGALAADEATGARPAAGEHPIDVQLEREEQARLVRSMLASLPPAQRQTLALSYYAGLSHSEIAIRLGEPLGTIKSRIRLGLENLRRAPEAGALA